MYKQGLFRDWVPRPVQTLVLFLLAIPVLMNSGIYTSNTADMVGGLGTLGEYISMASYMVTVGMVVVYPFLMPIKSWLPSKSILLISLTVGLLFNYVCATTIYPEVIIISSFFIGACKMFTMIELIIPIMAIISPTGNRALFFAVFYPLSISIGQCTAWLTAELAYAYNWQYVYYFMLILQLVCLVLILALFHDQRSAPSIRPKGLDGLSFILFSSMLISITYVLSFGRLEDWFSSLRIQLASILAGIMLLAFIMRQLIRESPYLDLSILTYKSVWGGCLFIILMNIFFATGSVQTAFTSLLRFSAQVNTTITLWMLPGILLAGISCYFWFNKVRRTFKGILLIGFGAFVLSHLLLYFRIDGGAGTYDLWLPMLLKGYGMTVLFISVGLYTTNSITKMGMAGVLSSGMVLILFRSLLGPLTFSAVYSTALYTGQVRNTADLAQHMDGLNPTSSARYQGAYLGAMAQGRGTQVSQMVAAQSLLGPVQVQATLVTVKQIFGGVVLVGFGVLTLIALFHFQPLNPRKLVNWRRRLRGWRLIPAA